MNRLINFLKYKKYNFKIIDDSSLIIFFSNNFKALIFKDINRKYHAESIYQNKYLFDYTDNINYKSMTDRIIFWKSCLKKYDFSADCSDGLVYIK